MHSLAVPASYRAFVEASLALVAAEIRRDAARRGDDDQRVQKLATVPANLIDATETGTLNLTLAVEATPYQHGFDDLPDHLKHFTHLIG